VPVAMVSNVLIPEKKKDKKVKEAA